MQDAELRSRNSTAHELNIEWTFSSNVHDAMRAYYRRAASPTLSLPAKVETDEKPVLSLFKRSTTSAMPEEGRSLWFWRTNPTELGSEETKKPPTPTEPPRKRRKLRPTKEKTLGDVMSSFGI